ncbi:TRAP transporter small permease [Alcaligenaceae bacterium]|nr:TRAP transporter small permease [Alcaligenaceae bacterium]
MALLEKQIRRLSIGLAILGMAILMALILVGVLDALLRHMSGKSVPGLVETTEILLVATVYLPIAFAYRHDAHVSADVALTLFPARWHKPMEMLGLLISIGLLIPVSYFSWEATVASFTSGEMRWGAVQLPLWPGRLSLSLGLSALALEVVSRLAGTIKTEDMAAEAGDMNK